MSNENCFRVCAEREIFRRTHLSGGGWSDTPKALICINKHCHGPVIYLKLPLAWVTITPGTAWQVES